jgi:hypothetical protein
VAGVSVRLHVLLFGSTSLSFGRHLSFFSALGIGPKPGDKVASRHELDAPDLQHRRPESSAAALLSPLSLTG